MRDFLAWLGDHLFAAVLAFFVAVGLGLLISNGGSGTASQAPVSSHLGKVDRGRVHLDSWPDRVSAWTVVLASAPTHGQAEAALAQARRVPSRGLNLGILYSSDYVDLVPGYWVAFAGQFDEVAEAQGAAERYRGQFATTYQRFIEER
jgi:hypothetical protein